MSDTTTTNEIFGQLGAAKIFTSSISNCLGTASNNNEEKIEKLEAEKAAETDPKRQAKIQKKIDRLSKGTNKAVKGAKKVVDSANKLLGKLAKFVDMTKEALVKWIANYLVMVLPAVEVAVKLILLTNFKKMASCSLDPKIPDEWRNTGILINEKEIDPRKILRSSPYSEYGKDQYFGIFDTDEDGEELQLQSRAYDMNAFIWYVKNCATYVSPFIIDNGTPQSSGLNCYFKCEEKDTLYNKHVLESDGKHYFLPGCTFKQSNESNTVFLCVERAGEDLKTCKYVIVPCSENLSGDTSAVITGCNWYKSINAGQAISEEAPRKRDYDKAKPLFKLTYSNSYSQSAALPKNNFKLQILPEPFKIGNMFLADLGQNALAIESLADGKVSKLLGQEISSGTTSATKMTWPNITNLKPIYARFDNTGTYSKRGRYSIDQHSFYVQQLGYVKKGNVKTYLPFKLTSKASNKSIYYLVYEIKKKKFHLTKNCPTDANPTLEELSTTDASKVLVECYAGKTVYEFNYDYVMSFRLFDSKVIATNIIKSLLNLSFPNPLKWLKSKDNYDSDYDSTTEECDTDQLYVDNMIDQMIQSMIEEDSEEFTDCFYTFTNDEYVQMENKTNQQLVNGTLETSYSDDINETYSILDAYKADATLNEKSEIITNALTKASELMDSANATGSSTSGYAASDDTDSSDDDDDEDGGGFLAFLMKAIKFLISCIVNAILTPKVLMIIQVNQKLMGNDPLSLDRNYSFSVKDVLNGMKGILTSMIKQIITMIQEELLRLIMKYIAIILSSYIKQLALEYAKKWVDLLKQLLMCFQFNSSSMDDDSRNGDNTMSIINSALDKIDDVNGADITTLAEQLIPNTNNC